MSQNAGNHRWALRPISRLVDPYEGVDAYVWAYLTLVPRSVGLLNGCDQASHNLDTTINIVAWTR
jgi:hypothetical protein